MAGKANAVLDSCLSGVSKELKGKLHYREVQINKHRASGKQVLFDLAKELCDARDDCIAEGSEVTFGNWLEEKLAMSRSSAYRMIGVWERLARPTVGQDVAKGGVLCFAAFDDSALYELAKNDVPEGAIKDAIKIAKRGLGMTKNEAKELIAKHKPASSRGPRIGNGSPVVSDNTVDAESVTPTPPKPPSVRATRVLVEAGIEPTPEQAAALAQYDATSQVELAKNVAIGAQDLATAVETGEIVDLGECPVCGKDKWSDDGTGLACNKCHHPHGEPAGDPDERACKEAKTLTVKTIEAAQRALDDLYAKCAGKDYKEGVEALKVALRIAKAWKV